MSQNQPPENVNNSLDKKPDSVLGGSGEVGEIVTPLPPPVNTEEKTTPENEGEIPVSENLDAEISSQVSAYSGFDPSIHASNKDGTPKFKADGSFALKRGRKPGGAISDPLPATGANPEATAQSPSNIDTSKPEAPKVDYTGLGKVYAGLFIGAGVGLIGAEWNPVDADERKRLETAFSMYTKSTNAVDLPPGWALLFALGIYSANRLPHPNTQSKLSKLKDKAKLLFLWIKTRGR